jgi:hypothetical protein
MDKDSLYVKEMQLGSTGPDLCTSKSLHVSGLEF